ncbi:DNA-binding transcriptional regulator, MarR family [Actinokineospora alba]|uniref:DNA-binding transcriptional regulator, MarR family n=1 Tax=Actinokineospora alba TaxID=504798 RepID=A0A1H0SNZ1_9PSEU|nr:MarR family transcriptional regulator [Actinokineospora alba]TDP66617.1 DNA-binding MarR family transcriptional regulator [Actinokineospora alba]SDJ38966.1 DNA-binding transcriptional regulator, MarR family [Actinokineospora alba]SDP43363.1 DNA-binding transcriptional regulator, MarR family [Actinokineospora alba]
MTSDAEQTAGDVPARLYLAIGRLSRSLRRSGSPGLGHGSISALSTLVACGELRLGDLAGKEGVAAPTMSRIVASLVESGLARREPDVADRRAFLVQATEEGERVVSGVRSTRVHELGRRLERLPADQLERLVAAIPVLEALLAEEQKP